MNYIIANISFSKSIAMAAGQKLYPRATVKKIVKAHSKRNVSKNVDVLVSSFDASVEYITNRIDRYFSIMLSSYKRTRYILPHGNAYTSPFQ